MITEPRTTTTSESRAYREALARLGCTRGREARANILEVMAIEAGYSAVNTYGAVLADSRDSTLAWEMAAVLLRQLAAAQRGLVLRMVGGYQEEDEDSAREWEDVARARTAREFTAAFAIMHADFLGELARQDQGEKATAVASPGDPASTAMARLRDAARAISEAAW